MTKYKEMYHTAQKTFCEHNEKVEKEIADLHKYYQGGRDMLNDTIKFWEDSSDFWQKRFEETNLKEFKLRERETGLLCECGKEECECVTFKLSDMKFTEEGELMREPEEVVFIEDIKEFIRLLKEEKVDYTTSRKRWLSNILNKLSGFSDDEKKEDAGR